MSYRGGLCEKKKGKKAKQKPNKQTKEKKKRWKKILEIMENKGITFWHNYLKNPKKKDVGVFIKL